MNRLSVVIPSRNAANLVPCLESIWQNEPSLQVIVVDDGLPFQPSGAQAEYIQGTKPFVFSRNVNSGILKAGDADVILLNDDALLKTPGGFTAMHRAAIEHPEFGVIASSCNNVGNHNQLPRHIPGQVLRDEPRTLCFICVLIPRRILNVVGLLDETFDGYGLDDDDYCVRARKIGLNLGIFDGCFVDHHSLTSTFRAPSPTNSSPGDFLPNMKIFIAKHGVDNWGQPRATSSYKSLFPPE